MDTPPPHPRRRRGGSDRAAAGRDDPADIAVALVSALTPRSEPPPPPSTLPKRTPVPAVPPPIPRRRTDLSFLAADARARATVAAVERNLAHPPPPVRRPTRMRAPIIGVLLSAAILFGFSGGALIAFVELTDDLARAILLLGLSLIAPLAGMVAAAVTRRLGGQRAAIATAATLGALLGLATSWAVRFASPWLVEHIPADAAALPGAAANAAAAGLAHAGAMGSPGLLAAWIAEAALCFAAVAAAARARSH